MERGIITPAIFSSRGIQMTDATNVMNMVEGLGFRELFKPIQMSYTLSSKENNSGRPKKSDDEISDTGEQTRNVGANIDKETD